MGFARRTRKIGLACLALGLACVVLYPSVEAWYQRWEEGLSPEDRLFHDACLAARTYRCVPPPSPMWVWIGVDFTRFLATGLGLAYLLRAYRERELDAVLDDVAGGDEVES